MKITVSDIEFQPDRNLPEQLKQYKTIGVLTKKTTKTAGNLLKITGGQSFCVKFKSDEKKCNIFSACYVENDTIILADYNNNKLKRLDSHNYTISDCYNLPGYPWQICKINETEVAVTLYSKQEIHFISVDRKMNTTNKIETDFDCLGLAYANNHLYISDATSVYIYTMTGRKLKQFSTDQSGHELFSDIVSLAVSKDATRIYVADGDKGLLVLDNNGQIVTTFNGEQLQGAIYCHLTEAGSVLVCGCNSNNVLQFTSDGELIGEIIKADSGKQGINSVCCIEQMSKMFISREDEDNIEVYDI
jgi:DNA-binding beta-propeller fold protein YncE